MRKKNWLNWLDKGLLVFLIMTGVNLSIISQKAYSETINKEFLQQGVAYSRSLIKNVQCHYVVQHFSNNKWQTTYEVDWAYKSGKSFLKEKTYGQEGELLEDIAYIFNGVNGYSVNYQKDKVLNVTIQNRERIEKIFGKIPPDSLFIRFWPIGIELEKILSDSRSKLLPNKENVEGSDCYVVYIESVKESNYTKNGYKVWLDPEKGFLPRKIKIYNTANELKVLLGPITLSNFGGKIWFPTEAKFTWFSPNSPQGSDEGRVNYYDIKINQGLEDKIFSPTFEPGTEIYDYTLDIPYIIPGVK